MKNDQLTNALETIANKEIPDTMNIWETIERKAGQPEQKHILYPRFRLPSTAVATLVIALVAVSTVIAYSLLTRDTLENTTYPVEDGAIALDEGTFVEMIVPDGASNTTWILDETTFGNLDDDEQEDAATILIQNTGGSGTFYHLYAIRNDAGTAQYMADMFLGDRIKLNSLEIVDNTIVIDYVKSGPDDPLCCPTMQVVETYQVNDGKLELIAGS